MGVGEEVLIQTHFRRECMLRTDPMDVAFDFVIIGARRTTLAVRKITRMHLLHFAVGVQLEASTFNHKAVT